MSVDKAIYITFNTALDLATITANNIFLSMNNSLINTAFIYNDKDNTITIKPLSHLTIKSQYEIIISTGLKNVYGTSLESDYNSIFTTSATAIDSNPPEFQILPPDASNINISENIVIRFNETIDIAATDTTINITGSAASAHNSQWSTTNVENDTITISPQGGVWNEGVLNITLTASDSSGNNSAIDASYTSNADIPMVISNEASDVNGNYILSNIGYFRFTFNEPMDPSHIDNNISTNQGVSYNTAWSNDNQTLEITPVTNWNEGLLQVNIRLYSANGIQMGSTISSTEYTVDTVAPTGTFNNASPANGSYMLSNTGSFVFTFNEAINISNASNSITSNQGVVLDSSWSDGNKTLTITPASGWNQGLLQLTVLVHDLAGYALSSVISSPEYTVDTIIPTASFISATPLNTNYMTSTSGSFIFNFSEPVDIANGANIISSNQGVALNITWSNGNQTLQIEPQTAWSQGSLFTTVRVYDVAGNIMASPVSSPNYTVDTIIPTANFLSATNTNGVYITSKIASFTFTFSEPINTAHAGNSITSTQGVVLTFSWSNETTLIVSPQTEWNEGNIQVSVRVFDKADLQMSTDTTSNTYLVDTIAPSHSSFSQSDNGAYNGDTLNIYYDSNIASSGNSYTVEVSYNGEDWFPIDPTFNASPTWNSNSLQLLPGEVSDATKGTVYSWGWNADDLCALVEFVRVTTIVLDEAGNSREQTSDEFDLNN